MHFLSTFHLSDRTTKN